MRLVAVASVLLLVVVLVACGPAEYTVVAKRIDREQRSYLVTMHVAGGEHETTVSRRCYEAARVGHVLPETLKWVDPVEAAAAELARRRQMVSEPTPAPVHSERCR